MSLEDGLKTCRYKISRGKLINKLFPMGDKDWKVGKGWYESPKAAKEAAKSPEDPVDIETGENLEKDAEEMAANIVAQGTLEISNDDSSNDN